MASVVLFHHVLGLTPGVVAIADAWRTAGHRVTTPDLFGGRSFDTIDAGAAFAFGDDLGPDELFARADAVVAGLPADLVYAGISLGVMPAQRLAQTRAGARAAILLEACVPPDHFAPRWPEGVPVQVHGMADDPYFAGEGDIDAARALVEEVGDPDRAALHVHPGDQHLFTDASRPSHVPEATAAVLDATTAFLATL